MSFMHIAYGVAILGFAIIVPGQFVLILAIGEHLQSFFSFIPLGVHAGGYQNYNRGHKARIALHILWVS